jgi:hypothetical protein
VRAVEMFEREWQSLKALRFAGAYTPVHVLTKSGI